MRVYGLYERLTLLYPVLTPFLILWNVNPAVGAWRIVWWVAVAGVSGLLVLRIPLARLIVTPDSVRYIGVLHSWTLPMDDHVAMELRGTWLELGHSRGGMPAFRDRSGRLRRCPLVAVYHDWHKATTTAAMYVVGFVISGAAENGLRGMFEYGGGELVSGGRNILGREVKRFASKAVGRAASHLAATVAWASTSAINYDVGESRYRAWAV